MVQYRVTKRWNRVTKRYRSAFARFIVAYGLRRLAKELQIHNTAVYHWVRGSTTPHPTHAVIIQRLARKAHFKLTLDEIYKHARNLRAREREAAPAEFAGTAAPPLEPARAHAEVTAGALATISKR